MSNFYSMNVKYIFGAVVIAIVGIGLYFYFNTTSPNTTTVEIIEEPTNFLKAGVIVFNNPGLKENTPYLIYEAPGQPALTMELSLDGLSVCAAQNGATPCIAMSVTLDVPFGGKRAIIEGIERDGVVIVRKLQRLAENETPRLGTPGSIFISWPHAISLLKECKVEGVMQTHGLDVYITLKDGRRVRAVEPVIDEIFHVLNGPDISCPKISVGTE